jgi:hypothetical protein
MRIFKRDFLRYDGVRPINIYFLRTLFLLMFLFVGFDSWSYILRHEGPWDPFKAAGWCMFASYSTLAGIGVFRPLKMLPIVLFMIGYKSLWLAVVAFPLWSAGALAGSSAEPMARIFMWMPVALLFMPWRYVLEHYLLGRPASSRSSRQTIAPPVPHTA